MLLYVQDYLLSSGPRSVANCSRSVIGPQDVSLSIEYVHEFRMPRL